MVKRVLLLSFLFLIHGFCFVTPAFSVEYGGMSIQPAPSDEDVELLTSESQSKRVASRGFPDVLVFPSRVEFKKIDAKWSSSDKAATMKLTVTPVAITDFPGSVEVETMSADVSTDAGQTWKTVSLEKNPQSDDWSANIEFANSQPAAGSGTGKDESNEKTSVDLRTRIVKSGVQTKSGSTTGQDDLFSGGTSIELKEGGDIIVCLRAVDSLGNITLELSQQMTPQSEEEVFFSSLIDDEAEPGRKKGRPDYELSPDRDILGTHTAWVRDQLFFKMNIAGTTSEANSVKPALNYYAIRFIPLDTSSLNSQLGKGMYQYHSVIPENKGVYQEKINEELPFHIDYDPLMLNQLAAIITEMKNQSKGTPMFKEYEKMLKEAGLGGALTGKPPLPARKTVDKTGIVSWHLFDNIYWKINTDAFKENDEQPSGIMVRFYTGYLQAKESSGINRDDRTVYATLLLRHHSFSSGKNAEALTEPVGKVEEPLLLEMKKAKPEENLLTEPNVIPAPTEPNETNTIEPPLQNKDKTKPEEKDLLKNLYGE